MPQNEMMQMASLFSESKMFKDVTSAALAFVKIQAGKEIGIAPFAAMSGIHIMQGKATVGATLMAGCVKASPKYDYKVLQITDKVCELEFFESGKSVGKSLFTSEDAQKAGTQNMSKFPKNMLFARAISNGVKWYCPDVFTMPVYTPEEMGDPNFTEDITHEEITLQAENNLSDTEKVDAVIKAIDHLETLETKKSVVDYSKSQPAFIIEDKSFQDAAKGRISVIMATPATNATA